MADPHVFESPGITVTWSRKRCLHAAECLMRLPPVFEVGRKPWIEPENAEADAIARTIGRCPTGSLKYTRNDGGPDETPDAENTIRVGRNGPLWVRGNLVLADTDGNEVAREMRVALCRCGQSANKPFCDGAHIATGFRERGDVFEGKHDPPAEAPGELRIVARENGPYKLEGPFTLVSADRKVTIVASGTALCRCGLSRNKPFCDSSHKSADFNAAPFEVGLDAPADSPAVVAESRESAGPSGPSSRPEDAEPVV